MKGYTSYIVSLITGLLLATKSFAMDPLDIKGHFFVNGKKMGMNHIMIKPGAPTQIEFFFTDRKTHEVIKDFKIMHGKLTHMVLIKQDFSEFKHVHPYFEPISGRFSITLNLNHADPDNFMAKTAFQTPGTYMLMADIIANGYGMRMFHRHLMAAGKYLTKPIIEDGFQKEFIVTNSKGEELKLEGILELERTPGCQGELLDFKFTLKMYEESKGEFQHIKNFNSWLSAGAHAVILSPGQKMMNMKMGHTHSPSPYPPIDNDKGRSFDPYFQFSLHNKEYKNRNLLIDGLQKIWIQVKIDKDVFTLPYVFHYESAKETPEICGET